MARSFYRGDGYYEVSLRGHWIARFIRLEDAKEYAEKFSKDEVKIGKAVSVYLGSNYALTTPVDPASGRKENRK